MQKLTPTMLHTEDLESRDCVQVFACLPAYQHEDKNKDATMLAIFAIQPQSIATGFIHSKCDPCSKQLAWPLSLSATVKSISSPCDIFVILEEEDHQDLFALLQLFLGVRSAYSPQTGPASAWPLANHPSIHLSIYLSLLLAREPASPAQISKHLSHPCELCTVQFDKGIKMNIGFIVDQAVFVPAGLTETLWP